MPGITSAGLSSNWKRLQEQLQANNKSPEDKSNGIKRKRAVETKTAKPAPRNVKPKVSGGTQNKRKTMGSYMSASTESHQKPLSSLTTDHDIPAADLTAAYGSSTSRPRKSTTSSTSSSSNLINTGLHPTHRAGKYLALDCEMVGTGPPPHADDLLARVSLVNFHGEQIYDSFVLPPGRARVEDYRTHVSGVTPWHLRAGYARPFDEAQRTVRDLLADKILVGHALKKDMAALQLTHPRRDVRDTSRFAKFRVESRGKPPALRNLARSELGLTIQVGEHSSVEDARATMALFRKEKQGFEEENRKVYGTKRRMVMGKGRREESLEAEGVGSDDEGEEDDDDDEDLDEEDLDLLEGEEDEFAQMREESGGAKKKAAPDKKKKKKKKKSRTKRK